MTLRDHPQSVPFLQAVNPEKEAVKLVQADKQDEFVTMLNFLDEDRAIAFAECIQKCRTHKLARREEFFFLVARSLVSVKGSRAKLFSQTIMQVAVPEFFGGSGRVETKHAKQQNDNS